jgi:hypothetical protein
VVHEQRETGQRELAGQQYQLPELELRLVVLVQFLEAPASTMYTMHSH